MKKFIILICAFIILLGSVSCAPENNKPILSSGSFSLSRGEFTYFFVRTVQSSLAAYSEEELSALGYDKSKSPSEQKYDNEKTWFDVFLSGALDYTRELLVLCEAAKEAEITLDASDGFESKLENFKSRIESTYSVDFEKYLEITYYGYTSAREFEQAFELELLASKFSAKIEAGILDSISDERVDAYIKENIELPNMTSTRNIMLIVTDSAARAEEILADLPDEDFASLAKKYSMSATYLYENCRTGELRPALDAWLGEDGRAIGDIGTVEDGGKFSIIYYFEDGEPISALDAKEALARGDYRKFIDALFDKFPVITNEEILASLDI
ncbi:MAG: hypothetical protein E7640_00180 [Ruminococcaceae bacterium]|nr:hypothetical protein [Oscillospiraceae bacterium]